jgi:hypothetical protein
MDHPCPACGFLVIAESYYGTYEICDVCGWEDDGVQLANPACGGGANSESLIEAQTTALQKYPLSVREIQGITRSEAWRPLSLEEIAEAEEEREQRYWKNKAVLETKDAYWRRTA